MESPERGALSLVRLVAGCIIVIGLVDAGLYLTQFVLPYFKLHHHVANQHPQPLSLFRISLDFIPIIAGIVALVKAKAIAAWLSDVIQ